MKSQIRVLIVNNCHTFIEQIKTVFLNHEFIRIVADETDGKKGLETILLHHNDYDIILLNIILSSIDGFEILDQMKAFNIYTKVIILTNIANENIIGKLNDYQNICYILYMPTVEKIEKQLMSINNQEPHKNERYNASITKILHELGVPSNIKGYHYMREGIGVVCRNPNINGLITRDLYPYIANMYDTTSQSVERAIRHAIEVSWNRGNYSLMESLFGHSIDYDRAKPTNSEFIATVADKILIEEY